jgi:hypothetical protein
MVKSSPSLTWQQVSVWRMVRHHLVERAAPERVLEVAGDLIGIQAQVLSSAELALWARVQNLPPGALSTLLWKQRALVKTWSMRGTVHLFVASEFPQIAAALRARYHITGAWLKYLDIPSVEVVTTIMMGIRSALDGRSLTREQLAAEVASATGLPQVEPILRSGWGELLKPAAYSGYLCFGPNQEQNVTFVRPDQWIGVAWQEYDPAEMLTAIARRYLATYGPATHQDFAHWWGGRFFREVRAAFHQLGDEITEVTIEGRRAWALTAMVEQIEDVPPPPPARLLPGFDAYVIGTLPHLEHVLPASLKARISRQSGWISPVLLARGQIAGVWRHEKRGKRVVVQIAPFGPLDAALKPAIQEEAERLGIFLGAPVEVVYSEQGLEASS